MIFRFRLLKLNVITPLQRANNEARQLKRLSHPSIIRLLGVSRQFDGTRPGVPCLLLPYFPNADVVHYIRRNPRVDRLGLVCLSCLVISVLVADLLSIGSGHR